MTNPHCVIARVHFKPPYPVYTTGRTIMNRYLRQLRKQGLKGYYMSYCGTVHIIWEKQ